MRPIHTYWSYCFRVFSFAQQFLWWQVVHLEQKKKQAQERTNSPQVPIQEGYLCTNQCLCPYQVHEQLSTGIPIQLYLSPVSITINISKELDFYVVIVTCMISYCNVYKQGPMQYSFNKARVCLSLSQTHLNIHAYMHLPVVSQYNLYKK